LLQAIKANFPEHLGEKSFVCMNITDGKLDNIQQIDAVKIKPKMKPLASQESK